MLLILRGGVVSIERGCNMTRRKVEPPVVVENMRVLRGDMWC